MFRAGISIPYLTISMSSKCAISKIINALLANTKPLKSVISNMIEVLFPTLNNLVQNINGKSSRKPFITPPEETLALPSLSNAFSYSRVSSLLLVISNKKVYTCFGCLQCSHHVLLHSSEL